MDTQVLRQEFLDLLLLLQHLNSTQLAFVLRFVAQRSMQNGGGTTSSNQNNVTGSPSSPSTQATSSPPQFSVPQLRDIVHKATPSQLEKLLSLVSVELKDSDISAVNHGPGASSIPKTQLEMFGTLAKLRQLQQLLGSMSLVHLVKMFEIFPSTTPAVQQLQLLQQLQQLLALLMPEALRNLHQEVAAAAMAADPTQILVRILQLSPDQIFLYGPLRQLLQLDLPELLRLKDIIPKLQPYQIISLINLIHNDIFDVLELRRLLVPGDPSDALGEHPVAMETDTPSFSIVPSLPSAPPAVRRFSESAVAPAAKPLSLRIVEQPPEKSVYKRNLKPNPVVQVLGDDNTLPDSQLYVAAVLIRCDNLEEQPKLLTGNAPVCVSTSRVIAFRKLKIMATSHQQGETLFAIRFELRRYFGELPANGPPPSTTTTTTTAATAAAAANAAVPYEVIDSVQSQPLCVLSHSTQLKSAPPLPAIIKEVIPASGSTSGGTRVVIIGGNYVDTPAARVRFDNIDVMPTWHGPGTLICATPQHAAGTVSVRVTNDSRHWSTTTATFVYGDPMPGPREAVVAGQIPGNSFRESSGSYPLDLDMAASLYESAFAGNYEQFRAAHSANHAGGSTDAIGGNAHAVSDVDRADSRGFTVLHYAAANGHSAIVSLLLRQHRHSLNVDAPDRYGNTALHWAARGGHSEVARLLVELGGAAVDAANADGVSPLHAAVHYDHGDIVQSLLEAGADPNGPMADGATALHIAAAIGNERLIRTLVDYGAWIAAADDDGDTPLHYAVREGHSVAVGMLVAMGAAVLATNEDGETPIHLAALCGDAYMVDVLLGANAVGSVVDIVDSHGQTPLHAAAMGGNNVAMVTLLKKVPPLSLNVTDVWGLSPLHYAAAAAADDIVASLVLAGADVDTVSCSAGLGTNTSANVNSNANMNLCSPAAAVWAANAPPVIGRVRALIGSCAAVVRGFQRQMALGSLEMRRKLGAVSALSPSTTTTIGTTIY